jgi:HTH-type transcriptional regulator, competence development regulator
MKKKGGLHAEESQSLGEYLANIRTVKRMTLRQVEETTGHEVSNAYLSQLENGKISKPSPNILHHLAQVYGVAYETLMDKAGYISVSASRKETRRHGRIPTFARENLTVAEEEALTEYLAFIRSRKGGK